MKTISRPLLRRLAHLDRRIRSQRYPNARNLASELEVTQRTIHRDLAFLRSTWGAPVAYCHKHNGFHYAEPDYALPAIRISEGELVALFLAERLMQQYRGTPYSCAIATAFTKLASALPEHVTLDLEHLAETLSVRPQAVPETDIKVFGRLARAVHDGRQLRIVYEGMHRGTQTERVIDPYHLAAVSDGFCVYAYCHLREDIRTFRPSRIRRLDETGERFDRPADFDVANYLDGAFGLVHGDKPRIVRLLLSGLAARYVPERKWHPSQTERKRRDGQLEVAFRLTHLVEIKRWVLAWGRECEVLAPAGLRRTVADEIAGMQALYAKKTGTKRVEQNPV